MVLSPLPITAAANSAIPIDPLVTRLRTEAAASTGGGMALVGGGILVSFFTVAALVTLLWLVIGLMGLGFTAWIIILGAMFAAGAFFWLKARSAQFATGAFEYIDPRQEWAGVGRYAGGIGGAVFTILDWLFVGPRMLIAGAHQMENREPPSRERFFDRCALLLRQLAKFGEAMPATAASIGEDETAEKLSPVVSYLDRAGWVGASSDGSRMWLSSKAKIDLMQMGIISTPDAE